MQNHLFPVEKFLYLLQEMVKENNRKTIKSIRKQKTVKNRNKTRKQRPIYTEEHYNSQDGMLTYVWGPPLWHFLHTMSFNYPNKPSASQKKDYRRFMESLQGILPCGKCRENLVKNYRALPLLQSDMADRASFSKYVYELHELVNRMLKKKSVITYEEVRDRYEHFRARCREIDEKVNVRVCKPGQKSGEKGCVQPVYGVKSKCVMNIVPLDDDCDTLTVDARCKSKIA
jgi:hypothetical protein